MAAHIVTCCYCKEKFNRDVLPFVQFSARRFAHQECHEEYERTKGKEEKVFEQLVNYILKLFEEDVLNIKIERQIKEYKEKYNYSYSGMLKSLQWWFEVKGNSVDKAQGGIGIVPFIYDQALNYYYGLYLAQLANKEKDINSFIPKTVEIEIETPKVYTKPPKLFWSDEEGV